MDRNDLIRLAGRLGDQSAISKALIAGADTQSLLEILVNIEPSSLSIEFFIKHAVRNAFETNRDKLIAGLIRLSEKIPDIERLKTAMRDYIEIERSKYEAQSRKEALDFFSSMTPRRHRRERNLPWLI